MNNCGNCDFAKKKSYYENGLRCHRFPPKNERTGGMFEETQIYSVFPKVYESDWCGEWRQNESK